MGEPKERPILFSGSMVRALLAGQKTQTRRVVTPGPGQAWLTPAVVQGVARFEHRKDDWWAMAVGEPPRIGHCGYVDGGHIGSVQCPYGQAGDRLYVRETIRLAKLYPGPHGERADSVYDADGALTKADAWPWKRPMLPSIHCPRGLSRILLEVSSVRVERLQDISEDDARAEGVQPIGDVGCPCEGDADDPGPHIAGCAWSHTDVDPVDEAHRASFAVLWDGLNGKRAAWASNPWLWVVGFKRVETRHG